MNANSILLALAVCGQLTFQRHDIDRFPGGYQAAVADVNGDGRPDVLVLSTQNDRVVWYANPDWRQFPVATTARNIDLAPHAVEGRLELALAAGFYFDDSRRGGEIFLLRPPGDWKSAWPSWEIARDPVSHRVRWGDVDGDGRQELVQAPIFGPGSNGAREPKPAHLWAFRVPRDPPFRQVEFFKIDETLTVLHGLWVGNLNADPAEELLTASFEGVYRFDFAGGPNGPSWTKTRIARGAPPTSDTAGAPRGTSEVVPIRQAGGRPALAALEPWHGNQVVVYTPSAEPSSWQRTVLDDGLREGHALVAADLDGDGDDEIVAGWRGEQGGIKIYDAGPTSDAKFRMDLLDIRIAVESIVPADLNGDQRIDLVAVGGRTNNLVWYENKSARPIAKAKREK